MRVRLSNASPSDTVRKRSKLAYPTTSLPDAHATVPAKNDAITFIYHHLMMKIGSPGSSLPNPGVPLHPKRDCDRHTPSFGTHTGHRDCRHKFQSTLSPQKYTQKHTHMGSASQKSTQYPMHAKAIPNTPIFFAGTLQSADQFSLCPGTYLSLARKPAYEATCIWGICHSCAAPPVRWHWVEMDG
ncbi:uncharacterized protein LOC121599889 [Anopheles merus]|uniref:uncharacterized protein LOC121599889 n=1 Tax=Anopheles merus TaxID=30066 RepID=UPI001BE43985|nr:uncharacterized protein LOC121599889 [Anopheles merus]